MIDTYKRRKTVLIFDDDPTYCKLMIQRGRKIDIDVIACQDMNSYCLTALKNDFDIALIDYNLEYFKGPDVAKVVEEKPVFLISGNPHIATQEKLWGDDIVGFFSKEVRPEEILFSAFSKTTT